MDGSVIEEKSSFKMLRLTFLSKLDWGSYIISTAKAASKNIGVLIRSMKLLSPEFALYLYKSIIQPCMEHSCHVWAGAPSCCLELLDKLQKQICRTVGPSLAASHVPLPYSQGLLIILIDCMIFLSIFLDVTRMSISSVTVLTRLGSGILCLQNAFP